jgi:hypothetical protein
MTDLHPISARSSGEWFKRKDVNKVLDFETATPKREGVADIALNDDGSNFECGQTSVPYRYIQLD